MTGIRVRHRACPIDGRIDCTAHVPAPRTRTRTERLRRAAAVAAHAALNGGYCPGWGRQGPHVVAIAELTADHDRPRSLGGEHDALVVRCRRCNSARGQG